MLNFKRLALTEVDWAELDSFCDRTVFETRPWLQFIEKTQSAEPAIIAIERAGERIGYFTGLIVNKFGIRILGSPFRGWTTSYMGFNLPPQFPRRSVLEAFPAYVFAELNCHYLEIVDRYITRDDYRDLGYEVEFYNGFEVDLTRSEEALFAGMKSACRRCIRKAKKSGVYIEEARDNGFVDDYYQQLIDVFAKNSLVPTYPKERVEELLRYLLPTGNLLLLRARNRKGTCIATGIFPAFNDMMIFWGGASWREQQILRPNEAIMWYAMRYWKARGISRFDMGGESDYKKKYGGREISVPRLMKAKYDALVKLRNLAEKSVRARQVIQGYTKSF